MEPSQNEWNDHTRLEVTNLRTGGRGLKDADQLSITFEWVPGSQGLES
jgi:hypothetical protein